MWWWKENKEEWMWHAKPGCLIEMKPRSQHLQRLSYRNLALGMFQKEKHMFKI